MTDLAAVRAKVQDALAKQSDASAATALAEAAAAEAGVCPWCVAGHRPVHQPHSREWVHRWDGGQFRITVCRRPPAG